MIPSRRVLMGSKPPALDATRSSHMRGLALVLLLASPVAFAATPSPPKRGGQEPFAPLLEHLESARRSKVSTACGSGVAPWAYRGRTYGAKTALRSYVTGKADRAWTAAFVHTLMREADWDSIGRCRTANRPCEQVHPVPLVLIEFQTDRSVYALLDFEWRCAQLFRANQPLGVVHLADRADSLLQMVRAVLRRDTLLQAMTLPPERSGPSLDSILVEQPPEVREQQTPVYPMAARNDGVQGTVFIQVLVGQDGNVRDAFVLNSIPKLDDAALDAVWRWKFEPAKVGGKPMAVWVAVPIQFTLQ